MLNYASDPHVNISKEMDFAFLVRLGSIFSSFVCRRSSQAFANHFSLNENPLPQKTSSFHGGGRVTMYGCFQTSRWDPKMDGENNGKPYEQMDDLGVPLFLEIPM